VQIFFVPASIPSNLRFSDYRVYKDLSLKDWYFIPSASRLDDSCSSPREFAR
jgi:hypothetical protein